MVAVNLRRDGHKDLIRAYFRTKLIPGLIWALALLTIGTALAGCQTHGLPIDPFAPFAIQVEPGSGTES